MMDKRGDKRIMRDFRARQSRQILAIAAAMFLVLSVAVLHKRPDIFGAYSKSMLFGAQVGLIAAFFGFTAYNWRCPSCGKFLGNNIHRNRCGRCGTRFRE